MDAGDGGKSIQERVDVIILSLKRAQLRPAADCFEDVAGDDCVGGRVHEHLVGNASLLPPGVAVLFLLGVGPVNTLRFDVEVPGRSDGIQHHCQRRTPHLEVTHSL